MIKKYISFLPQKGSDQARWFDNYIQNLPEIGQSLGMTSEEIEAKLIKVRAQQELTEEATQLKAKKENMFKLKKVNLLILFDEIKRDVERMRMNEKWTPDMSVKLQTDGISRTNDISTFQPVVTVTQNGGLVQVDYTKNGASGAHIYRRLPGETILTLIGRSTDSSFTDPLPQAAQGVPELRQYQIILLIKDKETGLHSKVMTLALGA